MIDYTWLARHMQCKPFSPGQQELLASVFEEMDVPRHIPVIHQNRSGKAIYLLRSGRVSIARKSDTGVKTELVAPRDVRIFGEMSFFSDEQTSADVVAEEHCVIYKMDHERFEQLRQQDPQLAICLLTMVVRNMADAIRHMNSKFIY